MPRAHCFSCAAILTFGLILHAPRSLQRAWVPLGARQVDLRSDHDVLRASGEGRFKRIRLVVEGGDLEMFDVRITFGDGSTFAPVARFYFNGKSRGHVMILPGAARVVRWIDFYYRSLPAGRRGKATVRLYGRR